MPINHEVKGNLARLLATEDLVVEHRKVSTACFNVHTRVLTLPIWDRASGGVYDLLVGHEVGHALYTPTEEWGEVESVPKSFVNITEDARIEKLMKRRYAGLNKTFYSGYKELYDDDFFSIADIDLNKYNLADRINLHCKIGNFTDIPFDDEEREILNIVNDAETFEESVYAAKLIYKYCKDEMENLASLTGHIEVLKSGQGSGDSKQVEIIPSDGTDGAGDGQPNTGQETGEKSSDSDKVNTDGKDNKPTGSHTDDKLKEPEILTSQNLENAINNLNDPESEEIAYVEVPKIDLKKLIVPPEKIHSLINVHNKTIISSDSYAAELYTKIDSSYAKFKKNIQKEVNYLVKEFECKKAADSYARASTSRTGVLDTRMIHTYKYNEDLFKKVTTFADGKSHGLIFILDWSGSMDKVMLNTVKQLFNIIWFCKRVGIPFDVYAFTEEYYEIDPVAFYRIPKKRSYQKAENVLNIGSDLNLLNLISSKCNLQTLETHMKNVYRMAYEFTNNYSNGYFTPPQLTLSGTPLNECLACLHELIPEFNKQNRVQKLHCIVLTDGEANNSTYHKEFERTSESGTPTRYFGVNYFGLNTALRIRKTGRTYSVNKNSLGLGSSAGVTKCIIDSLRDSYPETSFIGIRLLGSGDSSHFYRNYFEYGEQQDLAREQWKRERSLTIVDRAGYHKYFGFPSDSLSNNSTISIYATEITKTALTSAFKNSLNAKKLNKKFLNELVELIA
jgi:hypothetical protein